MLNILYAITLIIFIDLALFNPFAAEPGKLDDQILKQQVESNRYELRTSWPSFTGSSYIYLLGLFIKRKISISRHFQTVSESVMFRAAILLSQKYNITVNEKQFAYRVEDTNGRDVIQTLERACLAVSENQVLGIVGPEYSSETKTISYFANHIGLPVIGYSSTDPKLSNRNAYQTFYRLPPSDVVTAQALLKLYQKYKWNSTNIIYQSDNYGEGGLKALTEVFNNKIKISCAIKYDLSTDRIDDLQRQLEESSSRIVVVWADAIATTKILELALEAGNLLAPSFLWILIAPNSPMQMADNQNVNQLSGMLMLRLVTPSLFDIPINTTLLHDAMAVWKQYDPQSYPGDETQIDIYALYTFDAAWLLILAIEKLCQQNPSTCLSSVGNSSCFTSHLVNSNELNHIIQTMNFTGVSGYVQFQSNITDRVDSTTAYYMIDNLQLSEADRNQLQVVEVLKLNGTLMSTDCENASQWMKSGPTIQWPSKLPEPPKDYTRLEGKTLNITVYISPPFFMTKLDLYNISQPIGYIPDLVASLQKRIGFNYTFIEAPIEVSYDELVECVENHTYEVVMADLAITPSRTEKIDFSYPIYDNKMCFVIRKSHKKTIGPFAFFKAFSVELWLSILFIIFLNSALLIALYEFCGQNEAQKLEQNGNIHHENIIITILRSLYHTIEMLLQRGSELQPRTFFGCLQTIAVSIMSIILIALFTSNLIIFFTAQREKPWLQSIEDLEMCRKVSCDRIGVIERSQHEEFFTKEVMNGNQMNYYRLKHPNECYTKLLDGSIDVAIADSSSADYVTQTPGYCQLEVAGIPFGKTYFGIALPKQWRYKQDLDNNIMSLKLDGEIDRLLEKWFQKKNCDVENDLGNNGIDGGLTMLETSGLFYIFAGITVIDLIAFVVILLYLRRRNRSLLANNNLSNHNSATNEFQQVLDESIFII